MCLVIFAWLAVQDYFRELTSDDVRKRIFEDQRESIEEDMAPFGFILNGVDDQDVYVDESGDVWNKVDEYGDMSYMWEYK